MSIGTSVIEIPRTTGGVVRSAFRFSEDTAGIVLETGGELSNMALEALGLVILIGASLAMPRKTFGQADFDERND